MSKKTLVKDIALFVVALILLSCAVLSTVHLYSNGTDYTEEYKVYEQVKDLNTLEHARKTLQNLKIEYRITDKTLTLKDYSHISFSINSDDSILICEDDYMSNFQKLAEEDLSIVEVHGISQGSKIVEKVTIKTNPCVYTKLGNHYFVKHKGVSVPLVFGYLLGFVVLAFSIIDFIVEFRKAKRQNKQAE